MENMPRRDFEFIYPVEDTMDKYFEFSIDKSESNELFLRYLRERKSIYPGEKTKVKEEDKKQENV